MTVAVVDLLEAVIFASAGKAAQGTYIFADSFLRIGSAFGGECPCGKGTGRPCHVSIQKGAKELRGNQASGNDGLNKVTYIFPYVFCIQILDESNFIRYNYYI